MKFPVTVELPEIDVCLLLLEKTFVVCILSLLSVVSITTLFLQSSKYEKVVRTQLSAVAETGITILSPNSS